MNSTPAVFDFLDYKEYLLRLAKTQPRGFKKQLAENSGCQTAYISHVLNAHAHLSWDQAEAIASGLGHTDDEKEYFLLMLEYSKCGTASLKRFLKTRLHKIREKHLTIKDRVQVQATLSREHQAQYYSAWYYAAIHVMLTIPRFQSRESLCQHLNLSPKIVGDVLEFLVKMNLAVRNGSHFETGINKIHLEKDSPLIGQHHNNWRLQAMKTLENRTEEDLHYSSVFTLSEKDAQKIRARLVSEIQEIVTTVKDSKEEVTMALTADFFKI